MIRTYFSLFLTAMATLLLELSLLRVFDVILYSNISYFIITSALLFFGIAGIFSTLKPRENLKNKNRTLMKYTIGFSLFALITLPALNLNPFNFDLLPKAFVLQIFYFFLMYLFLAIPFFFAGIIFTTIFSVFPKHIKTLYFFDLVGAALGCVLVIPLIPQIGPGGILFVVAGIGLISASLFADKKNLILGLNIAALVLIILPFLKNDYYDFSEHVNKRGVLEAHENQAIEFTYWDPISKINVIDKGTNKHVAYDGGSQSSLIYPFDGNYTKLLEQIPQKVMNHFWERSVLSSHYLKRNNNSKVLIIGSAAGQETKAALLYGASHVDAIEMVGVVVDIGKHKYAEYNGNIFNDPRVNAVVGEGRSFLRASNTKYDIIQMFSNHTSSSMAAGTGAMATTYLQTADAYREYFTHLTPTGILHINHHIYPKMIATASLAWKELGLKDFDKHVIVYQKKGTTDYLPTMLVKMTKWTKDEVDELNDFFLKEKSNEPWTFQIVSNPIDASQNYLPHEFYTGNISKSTLARIPYRAKPSTDNEPYFNLLRKSVKVFDTDDKNYMNSSIAGLLNEQLRAGFIPMDIVHLILTGGVSIVFIFLFIFVPLYFANVGSSNKWHGKIKTLGYFASLGAGFIIFELVFIQIFMKLIGFPLYTYSAVVFIVLFSAGVGSYSTQLLKINLTNRWYWPFVGVLLSSLFIILTHSIIFQFFLSSSLMIRLLVSAIMIFPLGFFLGMPFPLGISAISNLPKGAIAWAWAMNGLFTTVGGLLSVIISIYWGFTQTLFVAIIIYIIAYLFFAKVRLLNLEKK